MFVGVRGEEVWILGSSLSQLWTYMLLLLCDKWAQLKSNLWPVVLRSVTWCAVCCSRKFPFNSTVVSIYLWNIASVMSFWSISVLSFFFFSPAVGLKPFRYGAWMDFYSQELDVPYICISLWIYVCMCLSLCTHNFLFTWGEKKVTSNLCWWW